MIRNGMRNNRRRTTRPRHVETNMQLRQHDRAQNRGIVYRGNPDPARVIIDPWNTIVVSTLQIGPSSPTNVCLTAAQLWQLLSAQLNLPSGATGTLRIIGFQAWHIVPNGELNNQVRIRAQSLVNLSDTCDSTRTVALLEDYGTPARNATVKFDWPKTHSANVLASTSTAVVLRTSFSAAQQVLYHVRVLWKPLAAASTVMTHNIDGSYNIVADEQSRLLHTVEDDFVSLSLQ